MPRRACQGDGETHEAVGRLRLDPAGRVRALRLRRLRTRPDG